MRKASHCGSKQQQSSPDEIILVVTVSKHNQLFTRFTSIIRGHSPRSLHRDHSIIACSRHIHIFLFFAHILFVVNHAINATPSERLQHHKGVIVLNFWPTGKFDKLPSKFTFFQALSATLQEYYKLFQFSYILFDCMKKSYMTDQLCLNVIYDETVGSQTRSFTTPAKYNSAELNQRWKCGNLGFGPSPQKQKQVVSSLSQSNVRINATFIENKRNFLTFLLQQKLALVITQNQGHT